MMNHRHILPQDRMPKGLVVLMKAVVPPISLPMATDHYSLLLGLDVFKAVWAGYLSAWVISYHIHGTSVTPVPENTRIHVLDTNPLV